jgi:hypothetical protein
MKRFRNIAIIAFLFFLGIYICGKIYSIEPTIIKVGRISDTLRMTADLLFLTKECRYRNFNHIDELNKCAEYIKEQFSNISDSVKYQNYNCKDLVFKNVVCSLGPMNAERIIIGAHYDVCGNREGADDNASGICGLIELARLLKKENLKYRIDFVAFSAEEPPFFKTNYMGSYIHAKSLYDKNIKVKGMICLEMIGYYSEEKNSQRYPIFFMRWFYGNKGNYITVVQKFANGSFGNFVNDYMKKDPIIPTKSFAGPKWIPGVDFSDHLNYWKFGYSAVMITNTAFYRNHNYHTSNDRLETLNLGKMGLVVDELYMTIKEFQK